MDKEILEKLDRRLANGEISEELYNEIKERYEREETEEDMGPEEVEIDIKKEKEEKGLEKEERVTITGTGSINGCNCEVFKASGAAKVKGDMNADEASISGATKVTGNAKVGRLGASGSLKIGGDTEAKSLDLSGATKFNGKVKTDEIDSSGSTKFNGDVEAKDFVSSGSMKAKNVISDVFTASGGFKISGTLKGEEISLKPAGDCKVNKIEGGDILVETKSSSGVLSGLLSSIGSGSGTLKSETIKGDDIYLENTRADLVQGDDVKIGPGCKIGRVKAKNLKVHESSTVDEKEQIKS